jgi:hypothetical protein
MGIKVTDLYVNTIAKGLLQPGEQLLARTSGFYQSFWTFQIPFFRHDYIVLVTSHRLILLDHRKGLIHDRLDKIDSFAWSQVQQAKLGGFLFGKKLALKLPTGALTIRVPGGFFAPKGNVDGAKAAIATWEGNRALPAAAPAYGALPA